MTRNEPNSAAATEAVTLPASVAERVKRIDHEPTRYLVAVILSRCIATGQPCPVHSKIVCRIISDRHYAGYLKAMAQFRDVVSRDKHYIPKKLCVNKPPKCMRWTPLRCQNNSDACGVALPLPSAFLSRLHSAFSWYFHVYLPSLTPDCQEAAELVKQHLELLGVPEVTEEEAATICKTDEAAADLVERCEKLNENGCSQAVKVDRGDRIYHDLTTLKKEIRARCTLDGEPIAEVDMHASFVAVLTSLYARGEERERLIAMLQTGDFYGSFAKLAGLDGSRVKQRFLRDVVFTFARGGNAMWQAFRKHFPKTARRLSWDRDWGAVVKTERKQDCNGRWFTCRTREGQQYLSRRLSMTESRVFWRGALLRLWREHQAPAIPIHDCLLVRERDAGKALAVVLACAEQVLGFRPVVKVKKH